ncbi:helix-turn-helix domain-containing protein [Oenococcus oeni]|uniref:helix-turn-helix domain-containing protein n=3 Tax=Oenococcus oeni TaxID=1247 RepID=UPI0002777751|nr:helix-turn-helix transcriptional regulator [Oenococcus oeni]EJN93091.1 Cro family protein, phage associated [Oenococcus oeni AWRIB304]EJO02393.1 Cro family protein, phage associated [Oenococcus oeni AWRIB318]EKP89558.1 Cro family protein, phage associated [Oenococcus oeni AWRIB202]KER91155.1 Cro/Cl family transcriptional regulator [Oenococcus oeni]KER91727.1 Cro/Cl family transcriptional regulator [Oenococcus oeni]
MIQLTIENARKRIANSQSKMASMLGMSTSAYQKYENYEQFFRIDKAAQFSALTGVPFESINFLGQSTIKSYKSNNLQPT